MKSSRVFIILLNEYYIKFRFLLKHRQHMSNNDDLVYIQVILSNDIYLQQTACLTEIVYQTYDSYSFIKIIEKELSLIFQILGQQTF